MPTALIMSAKFAPGHFSHMLAFYRLFEACGFDAALLLADGYRDFSAAAPEYRTFFLDASGVPAPDVLLIYNLSTVDMRTVSRFRRENPSLRVLFVYHEPWPGFRAWAAHFLRGRESFGESVKAFGRYIFVQPVMRSSETVLLPSGEALDCYKRHCAGFNRKARAVPFPLVFTDEADGMTAEPSGRKYFSFIATAWTNHGFDLFLDYVRYKASDPDALFQIATRSDISAALRERVFRDLIREKRLLVAQGRPLSNAEINRAYASSACVWLYYRRSFQSGVLCKAMMFGAPVLASDTGSFREFIDGDNGLVLPVGAANADIERAYQSIRRRLPEMSAAARQTFLRRFDFRAQTDAFREIIRG